MIRTNEMTILKQGMSEQEIQAAMESVNIAFVVDDVGTYIGCYTRAKGINTNSTFIWQSNDEEQLAKEIFAVNERIHNIPVLDRDGKILYQYVGGFEDFDFESKKYWEDRYYHGGTSGAGSYSRLAEFKAEIINQYIKENNINSLIEWGCGDGNQLSLFLPVDYRGYDVSKSAIELCSAKYAEEDGKRSFYVYDGSRIQVEKADMALSLDVIFHLVEDDVFENYMHNLFMSSAKHVCIYSSDIDNRIATHVRERRLTEYVKKAFPEWELVEYIKNRYPYSIEDPENTSFCDFYFYIKKHTK